MAFIILTDDAPEVEEYENNDLYFNESNAEADEENEKLLMRRRENPRLPINWWSFAKIVSK